MRETYRSNEGSYVIIEVVGENIQRQVAKSKTVATKPPRLELKELHED